MDNVVDTASVDTLYQPAVYRCSKGHEWEAMYGAPSGVVQIEGETFCLRCVLELLRVNAGSVAAP